jgi:ABC-type Fe3+/spermidine/putrescine transport system ATPase subunit
MNWIGSVGLRPEATRLSREDASPNATVVNSTFLGAVLHVEVRMTGGESLAAQVPHDVPAFTPGEQVRVWWREEEEMRLAQ